MFVPLVETAIAFAAVMLALSLFVSALVQIVQTVLHWRGLTLIEMLKSLLHGFRDHNETNHTHDEASATKFAQDILTDPTLHSRSMMSRYASSPDLLAKTIDYIHPTDLISLICNHANVMPTGPDGKLPSAWTGGKSLDYATAHNFATYIRRWFQTVEATHAQAYKRKMRRLTQTVSCLMVVLFCLDGFQLVRTLWANRTAAEAMTKQVDTLKDTAARLGVMPAAVPDPSAAASQARDDSAKLLALELEKTATILDDAHAGLGWQNAQIVKQWCAYKGYCDAAPPTGMRMLADFVMWLMGLIFSCVMLSLGAPFWVTTLSSLIRLQNEVQRTKQQPPPPGLGSQTLP